MSLLHKNAVLKEYRRQHREEGQKPAVLDDGDGDAGAGSAAAFPSLDAFQEVGAPAVSAPTHSPAAAGARREASHHAGDPTGTLPPPAARSVPGALGSAPVNGRRTTAAPPATGNDGVEDEFPDLDRAPMSATPPLPPPAVSATWHASPAPTSAGKQRTAGASGALQQRSRSDLTGEEDGGAGAAQSHTPQTDSSVSPTTVTMGAEAAANPTEGSESVQGQLARRQLAALPATPPMTSAQVHAAPVEGGVLLPTNARCHAGSEHPSAAEVSASSSASSVTPASPPLGPDGGGDPSPLREAAVRRLSAEHANVAGTESPDRDRLGGSAVSGAKQANMSDTQLQPPTSILSDPSILTMQQSKTLPPPFGGSGGQPLPSASQGGQRTGHVALHEDGSEENIFSPISDTDDHPNRIGSSAMAQRNDSLADSRLGVNAQQLTSFSGTTRTVPRIWDDVDVDVDATATMTDSAGRSSFAASSITFYEAFVDLTRELRRASSEMTATTTTASSPSTTRQTQVPPPSSHVAAAAAPSPRLPPPKRGGGLPSLFGCCGGRAAATTAAKQPGASAAASVGSGRHHDVPAPAAAAVPAAAPQDPDAHLRVVRVLKSQSLSLQLATHRRMLMTVFNTLTGKTPWPNATQLPPPSPSSSPSPPSSSTAVKWESIGFQGTNPATDVRATGVLGVLQLLYLIDYYPAFAQRLWRLCRDPGGEVPSPAASQSRRGVPAAAAMRGGISNELPFVLVCFNFTAVVLDAAGQHVLDAEVEKAAKATSSSSSRLPPLSRSGSAPGRPEAHLSSYPGVLVCCECYVGALVMFVEAWRARPRADEADHDGAGAAAHQPPRRPSIADFGDVKSRLRAQLVKKGAAKSMREAARSVV